MDLVTYLRVQVSGAKRARAMTKNSHLRSFWDGQVGAYEDALAAAQLAAEGHSLEWAAGTPGQHAARCTQAERVAA